MSRVTGRVEILVNGQLLLHKNGAVANGIGISGEAPFELTPVMGEGGIHGYVETPIEVSLDVTITDRDDVSLDTLARIRENGTIIFRAAGGGKSYTMQKATCTRNFKITSGEGETVVKFIGPFWTETVENS
jgi:hypothetical protein